ncbi:DUF4435 domain-containing protein [uncultured Anaerococcus sp.]|uniref:DUF4435 domain-containing protein n=1 Tax=uncultured Anaerococcus sp. TaxID=293428 RepID=UPI0026268AF9|nr:DUF4435 domain-containing protein [uncultured Anaerococcus sp.]
MKSYKYKLPKTNGGIEEHTTNNNSIIIIGANGSGKSKLGAWIEGEDPLDVHRIGAQRNLNFQENIPLNNLECSRNRIFYGTDIEYEIKNKDKRYRWDFGKAYTTKLLNDFDDVLAALIAMYNNETSEYFKICQDAEKNNSVKPKTPLTVIDKLMEIWNSIFPQRNLLFEDSKFYANERSKHFEKYSANQMSDGERAVLYLASQVLAIPENKTLIIDEPEIHIHGTIMNKLWESLERYRSDCLFIYITHDTNFAAYHKNSEKIWIKNYDGENWDLEKINSNELPEKLLFDIFGSRKDVIFVEGEQTSFDTILYSMIYTEYLIVPCGSCSQVILKTKAFKNTLSLHNFNVYGIIDRDFRTENEIEKLKKDNIFVLNVAEIENLFLVKELIMYMSNHMGLEYDDVFDKIKKYIIHKRLDKQIDKQVSKYLVNQIKYKLSIADITESDTKNSINEVFNSMDVNKLYNERLQYYKNIINDEDYDKTLEIFNEKNLAKSIGDYFDIHNNGYLTRVISILEKEESNKVFEIFNKYLPSEIPI